MILVVRETRQERHITCIGRQAAKGSPHIDSATSVLRFPSCGKSQASFVNWYLTPFYTSIDDAVASTVASTVATTASHPTVTAPDRNTFISAFGTGTLRRWQEKGL